LRMRDQFFQVASHELKNPLTSILGNAQLLQRRLTRSGGLTARDADPLGVIADQASQLNGLIATLFDVSRMAVGQFSIAPAPLDLDALVRRVVAAVRPAYTTHAIAYDGPELPLIVDGDALHLEQALQNLIQNAIKYSPAQRPVIVRVARRDEMVGIDVIDQGIGIPPAALSQLFERFYRAPNVETQPISGLGIGLYVVKEIVSRHGGTIAVASQEGQGSTFTITLPLAGHAASG